VVRTCVRLPAPVRPIHLDPAELRLAGVAMLGAGALLPVLPGHPGLACPLRAMTGIPCPLCGMTTSVEETVRLDVNDAIAANPAGVVAVAVALLLLVWRPARLRLPWQAVPVALLGMWAWELNRFSIL
jgi:Protein of unknown function (DUF2752)